jgi:U3 small nucleolar RNA-associated protein 20
VHVLGFVVHDMLQRVTRVWPVGSIDYAVPTIVDVRPVLPALPLCCALTPLAAQLLLSDIYGEVSDEKAVEKLASRMRETKRCMSFDSFERLSRSVQFNPYITGVIAPLQALLPELSSQKSLAKLEQVRPAACVGA